MAMTEITFSRDICPDVKRFTLDASDADKATQVNIPYWCKRVTIRPEGQKVRLSFTTSSDDINSDYIKLSADTPSEFTFWDGYKQSNAITAIYIANKAGTTSTTVSVLLEGAE
jgi:hypothetical protein